MSIEHWQIEQQFPLNNTSISELLLPLGEGFAPPVEVHGIIFKTPPSKERLPRSDSRQASLATAADTNCTKAWGGVLPEMRFTLHLSTMPSNLCRYAAKSYALTSHGKFPTIT